MFWISMPISCYSRSKLSINGNWCKLYSRMSWHRIQCCI